MIIGLTGGIATGKSNVSQYLAKRGYPIVDADKVTHEVQSKGQPGLREIIKTFGTRYLTPKGQLNRSRLGRFVFRHPEALRRLVRVIDPFIRNEIIRQLNLKSRGTKPVILDAPTLFESGYLYLVDQVWVVACEPRVQMKRLMTRNHLSVSAAVSRMSSQWPLTIKEALADVVINSDGSKQQTLNQVKSLIDYRK